MQTTGTTALLASVANQNEGRPTRGSGSDGICEYSSSISLSCYNKYAFVCCFGLY